MATYIGTPLELGLAPGSVEDFYLHNWPKRTPLSVPAYYDYLCRYPAGNGTAEATIVALAGGDIVAAMAARNRPFLLPDGGVLRGVEMSTWLVRQDHRSGGVGVKVLTALLNRSDFCLGASLTPEARDVYLRLGFRWRPALSRFVFAPDWTRLGPWMSQARLVQRTAAARSATGEPLEQVGWEDVELDDVDAAPRGAACFERSSAVVAWRFVANPFFRYRALRFGSHADPAFVIYRREDFDGQQALRVVDFIGSMALLTDLPLLLRALCLREGADCIDFFCSHVAAHDAFASSCWMCLPEEEAILDFPHLLAPPSKRSPNSYSYVYWIRPEHAASLRESQLLVTKQDCDMDRLAVVADHG